MIKAIIYSFKKSRRLRKISKIIGLVPEFGKPSNSMKYFTIEKIKKEEKALEELLKLCESDPYLTKVMEKYKADKEILRKAYEKLIMAGAGQWKRGHFVPASSLVYCQTLDYLLRNIDKEDKDFSFVAWRLLKYFEKGRIWKIKE